MSSPIYGEPQQSSTLVPCSTTDTTSGSTSSQTDAVMLSAMEKVVQYLKALETTKNKSLAMDSLNTLILTVKDELSKLK